MDKLAHAEKRWVSLAGKHLAVALLHLEVGRFCEPWVLLFGTENQKLILIWVIGILWHSVSFSGLRPTLRRVIPVLTTL